MVKIEKIELDLNDFRIRLRFKSKAPLVLHFDKPARRFYFSLIALVVNEMKKLDKPEYVYIRKHEKMLEQFDKSLSGRHASNTVENLWNKIRKSWRYILPDLETALHYKILDRKQIPPYEKGGKYKYECSEDECDIWANLFQHDENNIWRFKFAADSVLLKMSDIQIRMGTLRNQSAWEKFVKTIFSVKEVNYIEKERKKKTNSKIWFWAAISAVLFILSVLSGITIWKPHLQLVQTQIEPESYKKPSIAVMPFLNISDDPNKEYFCDGITEDIITNLSKISGLFVISRSSSFVYKGKEVKAQEAAKELGVSYMLEGSVRWADDKLRITAQLIDGKTGEHMWADIYDRQVKDIFAVQDDVTQKVVSELAVTLKAPERDRLSRKHTENFEAYELYLRARKESRILKKENHLKGIELCQRIIKLDPNFAGGYQNYSYLLSRMVRFGYSNFPREDLEKALELAQKAVSVDDTFALGHLALSSVYLNMGQQDDALAEAMAAARIEPGSSETHKWLAFYLHWTGRGEKAVKAIKKAQQLNPNYLRIGDPAYQDFWGYAAFTAGKYEESIAAMKNAIELYGPFVNRQAFMTASYMELGRDEEARAMAQQLLKNRPTFSLKLWRLARLYKNPKDTERLLNALQKAGLK